MAEILTEQIETMNSQPTTSHITGAGEFPLAAENKGHGDKDKKPLPKGVVLGKDGKPCRTCTSMADWRALTKKHSSTAAASSSTAAAAGATTTPATQQNGNSTTTSSSSTIPDDCPPDVEALGRSSWTLLHSLTATYPSSATPQQQSDMSSFLNLFAKFYPCWVCAEDFHNWMNEPSGANRPRLKGRDEFGNWMCEAHNAVNRKLGKKEFDCKRWEERWRTGWKDGRCD